MSIIQYFSIALIVATLIAAYFLRDIYFL